jgi:DivIVA domain-containing protein
MISASIPETHRFGRVRKNGYDPAEVDAVVQRMVDALRQYDERVTSLTEKIDAADASADAIRRTFVAAQETRDQIIVDARVEASTITESATLKVTTLARTAEELQAEIAASRDRILTGLYADAESRMLEIERATAQRTIDAEWAIHTAIETRDHNLSVMEADAEIAKHSAQSEVARLRSRIATMSEAATSLEQAAEAFAATAREGARVIDLTAVEDLDRPPVVDDTSNDHTEPEAVIDDKPLRSVAVPADDTTDEEEHPRTRYQKSEGVPLKERIKIARMSG